MEDAAILQRNEPLAAEQLEQERVRREEVRQQQAELQANPRPVVDTHDDNVCSNCIEAYGENGIHTCGTCNYKMCGVCVEYIRAQPQWITPHQCPQCRQEL